MTDPIQQIEERLNSKIGMVIEYNPKSDGVLIAELTSNRQDIQNLLKLVRAMEVLLSKKHCQSPYEYCGQLEDYEKIKKEIFEGA